MKNLLYILTLFTLFGCSNSKENITPKINLNGAWEFYHEQTNNWYSATVPGVIHTDLLANNLIEEPYWETNEDSLQWIEDVDWKYQKTFMVTESQLQDDNIEIEFEGLDTYAEVKLNGALIISANNMLEHGKLTLNRF